MPAPPTGFRPSTSPESSLEQVAPPTLTHQDPEEKVQYQETEPDQSSLPEAPDPPKHVVAYSGNLDMPMVHSICSLNLKPDYDEINPALAVFSKLAPGEVGFIHLASRPADPASSQTAQTMLNQLSMDMPLEDGRSLLKTLGKYSKYLMEALIYSFSSSRAMAPVPPWKPDEAIKPPARHTQSEESKAAISFAQEKVQARRYFDSKLYVGVIGEKENEEAMDHTCQELQAEFNASYSNGATGQGFVYRPCSGIEAVAGLLPVQRSNDCLLSPPEMGEMMKVPDGQTGSHAVNVDRGMKSAPPRKPIIINDPLEPPPGMLGFGEIDIGTSKRKAIGLPIKGLNTHMYLCGTTGSGKSTIMEWFIYGLAKNDKCMFVIDPHGTLVDNALKSILAYAPERADDCLVLDFGNSEFPIAFNPIAISSASEIEPTTNSVKEMILKMLGLSADSAPRAVNYVEQAVWAMAEANLRALGGHKHLALTLLQVPDFFTDKEFRQLVIQFCTNLSIRSTFDPDGPFEKLGERQQLDHVMPVLRTFSSLAVKDSFGNIFGQSESKIDFAKWVREKKIVLMKLPAIASDASVATFIGAMVTPMLIGSLSKWGHNPNLAAYLIIDEFQNYATESYKSLLAQTRKHGLHGIAANQVPQDLPADVLRGVQSNTQTKISMRLDPRAVKEVADFIASGEAHPRTEDILALPNYWAWANHMMDDGTTSGPFVFKGLAPPYDEDAFDTSHPAWLPCMDEERYRAGKDQYDTLFPEVMNASQLASAAPRDIVWERRQKHIKEVRAVLEHKIQERLRTGGFEGSFSSKSEELMDDFNQWG
jgi:hypothetical protein